MVNDAFLREREILEHLRRSCQRTNRLIRRQDIEDALLPLVFLRCMLNARRSTGNDVGGIDDRLWQSLWMPDSARLFHGLTRDLEDRYPDLVGVLSGLDFTDARRSGVEESRESFLSTLQQAATALAASPATDLLGRIIECNADVFPGEFGFSHTAQSCAQLMADLMEPRAGETVYCPECGTGSLMMAGLQRGTPVQMSGDEVHLRSLTTCRMRLALASERRIVVRQSPAYSEPLKACDVLLTNMVPGWDRRELETGHLFPGVFGRMKPHKSLGGLHKLTLAIHAIHQRNGRAACLIPQGPLFRQGVYQDFRHILLETNLLNAVISLPVGAIPDVTAPLAIAVFTCGRSADAPIAFIDASDRFADGRVRNRSRPERTFDDILAVYRSHSDSAGFARWVTPDVVRAANAHLGMGVYVSRCEPRLPTESPDHLATALDDLDKRIATVVERRKALNVMGDD